jgi:hypothetical protein
MLFCTTLVVAAGGPVQLGLVALLLLSRILLVHQMAELNRDASERQHELVSPCGPLLISPIPG